MRKLSTKCGFSLIEILLYLSCSAGLLAVIIHYHTQIEAYFHNLDKTVELNDQKRFLGLYLTEHLAFLPTELPKILTDHPTKITGKLNTITTIHGYDHATDLPFKPTSTLKGPVLELNNYSLADLTKVTRSYLAIARSSTTKQYSLYQIRSGHPKTEIVPGISSWQISYGIKTHKNKISYFSASEIDEEQLWPVICVIKIIVHLKADTQTTQAIFLIPLNYPNL